MADMGTKEAAEKWGLSQRQIQELCRNGKIPGATQDFPGSTWHIPKNTPKPKIKERKKK